MTRTLLAPLFITILLGLALPARADVLLIEPVRHSADMNLPQNGQTKAEVRAAFGEPKAQHAPVGDPPITRWEYERWSVYFEHGSVLFTVLHKGEVLSKKD